MAGLDTMEVVMSVSVSSLVAGLRQQQYRRFRAKASHAVCRSARALTVEDREDIFHDVLVGILADETSTASAAEAVVFVRARRVASTQQRNLNCRRRLSDQHHSDIVERSASYPAQPDWVAAVCAGGTAVPTQILSPVPTPAPTDWSGALALLPPGQLRVVAEFIEHEAGDGPSCWTEADKRQFRRALATLRVALAKGSRTGSCGIARRVEGRRGCASDSVAS